ncbi:hypothetical protein C8F04DRAFT_1193584 [Mycena alexandri]|uniref:Uncharacterized protein n=1 Tax=Mycena alexandri TaxID=1745969 RepID=A0AAD6WS66_9AGAR|nr:hypothetical protein C8F04DRAFT_1193584 [Mycena alexandri]
MPGLDSPLEPPHQVSLPTPARRSTASRRSPVAIPRRPPPCKKCLVPATPCRRPGFQPRQKAAPGQQECQGPRTERTALPKHQAVAAAARRAHFERAPHPLASAQGLAWAHIDPASSRTATTPWTSWSAHSRGSSCCAVSVVGGAPRAVIAEDNSLVALLGGVLSEEAWLTRCVEPATEACEEAAPHVVRSPEETEKNPGVLLNALIFFELMSSLAMKHLLGYGNRLLSVFCPTAYNPLHDEKRSFLDKKPDLLYPSDSSVFSAATFELGGPHRRSLALGVPHRYIPGAWECPHGPRQIQFAAWGSHHSLGARLRRVLPAGSSILLPTGLNSLLLLLQYAGSGIPRWFRNGQNTDVEFAMKADEEKHAAREERRQAAHADALDAIPLEEELPQEHMLLRFVGTH